jgi:hypothetical protein
MKNRLTLNVTAALFVAGSLLMMTPAQAAGVQIGTLTCDVEPSVSFLVGSSKDVHCAYQNTRGMEERYVGTINRVGLDIGFSRGGKMVWGVIAPSSDIEPGSLEGRYAGASAGATVGVGVGANLLVGGLDKSISLQPLSVEGNIGLNLAAGIGALNLRHAG